VISSTWTGKRCARLLHQASCPSTVDRACCCRSGRAIEPRPDYRFVDDGEVVTAAGVSAGIDMALHLVGRLGSPEKARDVRHYNKRVGPTVLSELEETPFGDRHYRVEGPEGHRTLPDCSARSTRRIRSGTPGAGWIDVGHIASNRLYARPTIGRRSLRSEREATMAGQTVVLMNWRQYSTSVDMKTPLTGANERL